MASSVNKILFYTDTPLYGGAEKHMLILAKHLNPLKYKAVFVVRQSEKLEDWYAEIRRAGLELHIIKTRGKNSPGNLPELLKLIKKIRPALIHAHIWNPLACKYAFAAALLSGIPIVSTEHDPFAVQGSHRKIYKNLTLRQTARVITVSNANRQLMCQLYPKFSSKVTTVHNGIEAASGQISEQQKLRLKKEVFQAGPQTRIIFSAGALHPRKGFKYLILAFRELAAKMDNIKLVIAGLGPTQPDLVQLIKNFALEKKTVLLGQRPDIEQLMQASDVFVLPSLKEAFGLVIVEAMQNGLPVIATAAGGVPEIISSEQYGLLVKPASKQALARALQKLLTHPELQKKLRENGLQHWKEFSADKMARHTEAVYYLALNPKT